MVFATQTLSLSAQPCDTNIVTIGGKVYTFQTTLTNVDGNVKIGSSTSVSLDNLKAAVNLGSGAGTAYATAMTANTRVVATTKTASTLKFSALVPGELGNLIVSTTTVGTSGSFGAGTLASGAGNISTDLRALIASSQLNASVVQQLIDMIDPEADE